ncbi:hypothetical protein [Pseudonocardia adelaidensis]|uniref:hypothetical protein n=1 Tax=Pseudonocardia adelaidensis TaxID=648754 RepID=UPI0031E845E1
MGEPLIGVEDMETQRWAEGYAATANAGLRAVAAKVPGTVALAVRWAWRASPPLTLLAGAVQLAAGAVTAFGPARRRGSVTSTLITGRDPAAEVRAFTTQRVLPAEHRRVGDLITCRR